MAKDHDVFMNGVIENNEGNWFECVNYGEDRVGGGSGGLGSIMGNSEIIIDKEFGENNKNIFQVEFEANAQQEQLLVQLEFNQKYWLTWQK